jgi:D-glycero-alpha-D-manno-heptose-7-phosphate kinase
MIIVQTPLRVGLVGGGTDLPAFAEREPGYVLSAAIDKYVYVILKDRFDDLIYVNYSRKEIAATVDQVEHDLVHEAMRRTGVRGGVEVTTLADVPAEGTGLGSSSAILVGLLHAFYAYGGTLKGKEELAREACEIEIGVLGRPIGRQDQYACAYGDLHLFGFGAGGVVTVEPVVLSDAARRRLGSNLMLVYSGRQRLSRDVLQRQNARAEQNLPALRRLRDMALDAHAALERGEVDALGELLHQNWLLKRGLADGVSTPEVDAMYEQARAAGALGGKLTGAGGGGFLLLYCPPGQQEAVREALGGPRVLTCDIDRLGTRIIFSVGR